MMTNTNDTEAADTDNESTQEIAHRNEDKILRYLHYFGYMTAPQVGIAVYRECSQSERLARRTLARLVKQDYVLCHKAAFGSYHHFALSLSGAKRVWDVYELRAVSGKDLIRAPSKHRDAANWVAIRLMLQGMYVFSERQIQKGDAPFKEMAHKVPDTLGHSDNGYTTWVEIEASRRGGRDMSSLADWLVHQAFPRDGVYPAPLNPPRDSLFLEKVRFVIASPTANTFPSRLKAALEKRLINMSVYHFASGTIEFQFGIELNAKIQYGYIDRGPEYSAERFIVND